MSSSEEVVREAYAVAEGDRLDVDRFAGLFGDHGYFLDMASGQRFTGDEVRQPILGLASAFPDFHRELLNIYSSGDGVVVVELRLQGTHLGDFQSPDGVMPPSGRTFDVPCCDVFQVRDGKVASFHCYNMKSIWLEQLAASDG